MSSPITIDSVPAEVETEIRDAVPRRDSLEPGGGVAGYDVVGVGCHLATEADPPPAHQSEDTNSLEILINNEYLYATYMQ